MISKIDIDRRNTGIYQDDSHNKKINNRIKKLTNHDMEIIKSPKFNHYMEKLLTAYSHGKDGLRLPLFHSRAFPYLVISKFNSYDLESTLVYDYLTNSLFFNRRV